MITVPLVHLYPPFFQVYTDLAVRFRLPLRVPFPPEANFARAVKTLPFLEGFPRDLVRGMVATVGFGGGLRVLRDCHRTIVLSSWTG